MAYLADYDDLKLVVCASTKQKKTKVYHKIIEKLGLADRVIWQYQLPKRELYNWVHGAVFSLAPLKECSRNLEQGCCPLKILESMAVGTPVIASNLPVVNEIISDASLGKLVRADRPAELARAMRILLDYPELRQQLSEQGKTHIKTHFTWQQKREELKAFYARIVV
jgi:glycosyltransferase involved in cell wall biosynthesis